MGCAFFVKNVGTLGARVGLGSCAWRVAGSVFLKSLGAFMPFKTYW